MTWNFIRLAVFLSIQAQDFIEDSGPAATRPPTPRRFLSIQAQDFIEDSHLRLADQNVIYS